MCCGESFSILIKCLKSIAVFLRLHAPQMFLKLKGLPHAIAIQGWYMNFTYACFFTTLLNFPYWKLGRII